MTPSDRLGVALVITAPSGTGKSTLIRRLRAEFPEIGFSVSCTTRPARPGERDGVDYRFVDQATFQSLAGANHFAEWAVVHGNAYGTPRQGVLDQLAAGQDLLFDIDVQGAKALRENLDVVRCVFLLPPSRRALEERLAGRGSDSPDVMARRLANARTEIEQAPLFDYLIVNDDLDTAYGELRAVYLAERSRTGSRPGLVSALLAQWPA